MYSRNAVLDHQPSDLITESSMPAWAADVEAPTQKLWHEYKDTSFMPTSVNASRTREMNWGLVKGEPFSHQKKGPGSESRMAM